MRLRLSDLFRRSEQASVGYSRGLQAARIRAAYLRSYFSPAIFSVIPIATESIATMAVDSHWRLYYNERWLATHDVEQNAALVLHHISHLVRDHAGRRKDAGETDSARWNASVDAEINEDFAELELPPSTPGCDCGSGAHAERRFWELGADEDSSGIGAIDSTKAELLRRDIARRIDASSPYADGVSKSWRRWAKATLVPQVDYLATIRHVVRRGLRSSTLGRYDRTYRRLHRRQSAYGEFIMPSFEQPRPRPGFLIDTSSSMNDLRLARAVAELAGLARQLGYGADILVGCCDAALQSVRSKFSAKQIELTGGGGTDLRTGIAEFIRRHGATLDLLVVVTDCCTPWPDEPPPFTVITIRVGDGAPAVWAERGGNSVITVRD